MVEVTHILCVKESTYNTLKFTQVDRNQIFVYIKNIFLYFAHIDFKAPIIDDNFYSMAQH